MVENIRHLRWGIIGPGAIAERFAEQLPLSSTGILAAVASRDPQRARDFAERHGDAHTRVHATYEDLLADPAVDAVYLATVHTEHAIWAIRAADAGKHVLCEKPLTPTFAATMAVHEAARRNEVVVLEGYMYLHHPQAAVVLDLVAAGRIGRLRHIEAGFAFAARQKSGRLFEPALAGGALLDVGGYPASAAQAIVVAAGGSADPIAVDGDAALTECGVDGWTTASLTFADGVTAQLWAGITLGAPHELVVRGSEGVLEIEQPWVQTPGEPTRVTVRRAGSPVEILEIPGAAPYAAEADALAALVEDPGSRHAPTAASLALARLQARWRAAIGVRYPFERDDADIPTLDRRPLTRRTSTMRYGRIDGVDKDISRLVFGCDNQRDLGFGSVVWDDFLERGGNAFDTAFEYSGRLQERLLGQWMANRGVRDEVFVIGKGAHTPYCDPENLESQLLGTLEDLQTDHLDLYFMHRDNEEVPVGEFVDVLDRYHRAGAIRAFGGSNWSRERFEAANAYARREGKQGFTALSNHFGLAEAYDLPWAGCRHVTDPESKRWLEEAGIPLFPWASQARGFFSRADPDDTSDAQLVRCYYGDGNFERLARAKELAARLGVTPTAVALAFVLHQRFPTFAIIGPRTIEETRTSTAALDLELDDATIAWLDLRD